MGYCGLQDIRNRVSDKEELETYSLGDFSLNGGGKNDYLFRDFNAKVLSDYKENKSLHLEGIFSTPFGVYQEVEIYAPAPDNLTDNGKEFSELTAEEKEEALKDGVRKKLHEPGENWIFCSEEKF
ncbi:MAG: hypothetical protein ABEK36_02870 [Candidatus Aenigmatarchaeota archaeon]